MSQPSAYQKVTSTFDVTEAGQPNNFYLFHGGSGNPRWMQTPSIDFTGTYKVTLFAGVRKLSDAARGAIVSTNIGNNGTFEFNSPGSDPGNSDYRFASRGTSPSFALSPNTFPAPNTAVLCGIGDISGDSSILRANATQAAQSTDDQGTGNYTSAAVFIGARAGTSLFLNGHIHSLIVRGALTDLPTIERTERYVASKTAGVSL
jgi:hypothetical protein